MTAPLRLTPRLFPPGASSRRPLLSRGQEVRLYVDATDEAGLPVAATGVRLELRRPDGAIEVFSGGSVASTAPGIFYAEAQAGQDGLWRYEWICTGPREARAGGSFTVQPTTVQPPGPNPPVLVTQDLAPVVSEGGGTITAVRVTQLPAVTDTTGLELVGSQGGVSKKAPWATLQAAAAAAGQAAGQIAGAGGVIVVDGGAGVPANQPLGPSDTAAWQGALNEAASRGGGIVIGVPGRKYNITGTGLIAWDSTVIALPMAAGGSRTNADGFAFTDAPGFYLDSTATIRLRGATPQNLYGVRKGLFDPIGRDKTSGYPIHPQVMRDCCDQREAFAGTFLLFEGGASSIDSSERSARDIACFGFDVGVKIQDAARVILRGYFADVNTGVWCDNAGGMFRTGDWHVTSFLTKNLRGAAGVSTPIVECFDVGGKLGVRVGPHADTKTKAWRAGQSYDKGATVKNAGGYYRSTAPGISGNAGPTHTTGQPLSDAGTTGYGVPWDYRGPFTGAAYAADVWELAALDGQPWLRAGDWLFLSADPIWFSGLDISLNTLITGRGRVQVLQKLAAGTYGAHSWLLDTAYRPDLAAALIGRDLVASPGVRWGVGMRVDNADNTILEATGVKGPRVGYYFNGSAVVALKANYEAANEGEAQADDWGNVAMVFGENAVDCRAIACAIKSAGTSFINDSQANDPNVFDACEISANASGTVFENRRGAVQVQLGVVRDGWMHAFAGSQMTELLDPDAGEAREVLVARYRITRVARASGVATLTLRTTHGLKVGAVVAVEVDAAGADASFGGNFSVQAGSGATTVVLLQPGLPNVTERDAAGGGTVTGRAELDGGYTTKFRRTGTLANAATPRQKVFQRAPNGFAAVAQKPAPYHTPGEVITSEMLAAGAVLRVARNGFDGNEYVYAAVTAGTCGAATPQALPVKIRSGARASGTVTVETNRPHGAAVGDTVTVTGPTPAGFAVAGVAVTAVAGIESLAWAQAGANEAVTKGDVVAQVTDGGVTWRWVGAWLGGYIGIDVDGDLGETLIHAYDSATGFGKLIGRFHKDGLDVAGALKNAATGATYLDGGAVPVLLRGGIEAAPTGGQVVGRFVAERACTMAASMAGSFGRAGVAASATAIFSIRQNGSEVATMRFNAGAANATWPLPVAPVSIAAGDVITVVAPASPDATLAQVTYALALARA